MSSQYINKLVNESPFDFVGKLEKESVDMILVEAPKEMLEDFASEKNQSFLDSLIASVRQTGVFAIYTPKKYEREVFKSLLEKGLVTLNLMEHQDNPTFSSRKEPLSVMVMGKTKNRTKSYVSGFSRKYKLPYIHDFFRDTKLPRELITDFTQENDLVYITFGGKGNEIVSCLDLKRNWIANEVEEKKLAYIDKRTGKLEATLQRRKRY